MPHRFPPLAPQPPARPQQRVLPPLPLPELGLLAFLGLLLLA
ncbi:hypothetical protein [Pseudotabrizicola algicola]|nr:hypothetical protein [Pseudotabrizicola algicola]